MMNLNFFNLLMKKSPLEGLLDHYKKIRESVDIINDSFQCYLDRNQNVEFKDLQFRLNELESQADKNIRNIRNNLPRNIFMPVNKITVLNYTSAQDNILDSAQEALNWLSMKKITVPDEFQDDITNMVSEAANTIVLLGPALKETVSLVHLENLDLESTKKRYREIRNKKAEIFRLKHDLNARIYQSDMEFKDIYLLIQFNEKMFSMGHSVSKCVEILRTMITR